MKAAVVHPFDKPLLKCDLSAQVPLILSEVCMAGWNPSRAAAYLNKSFSRGSSLPPDSAIASNDALQSNHFLASDLMDST
jgi:hypothetical protein